MPSKPWTSRPWAGACSVAVEIQTTASSPRPAHANRASAPGSASVTSQTALASSVSIGGTTTQPVRTVCARSYSTNPSRPTLAMSG